VLAFRPQQEAELQNASLSLAANLAIADALLAHRTGLFRVMPEPDERAVYRLRHSAKALGLSWPKDMPLKQFEKGLDQANPRRPAFAAAFDSRWACAVAWGALYDWGPIQRAPPYGGRVQYPSCHL